MVIDMAKSNAHELIQEFLQVSTAIKKSLAEKPIPLSAYTNGELDNLQKRMTRAFAGLSNQAEKDPDLKKMMQDFQLEYQQVKANVDLVSLMSPESAINMHNDFFNSKSGQKMLKAYAGHYADAKNETNRKICAGHLTEVAPELPKRDRYKNVVHEVRQLTEDEQKRLENRTLHNGL